MTTFQIQNSNKCGCISAICSHNSSVLKAGQVFHFLIPVTHTVTVSVSKVCCHLYKQQHLYALYVFRPATKRLCAGPLTLLVHYSTTFWPGVHTAAFSDVSGLRGKS